MSDLNHWPTDSTSLNFFLKALCFIQGTQIRTALRPLLSGIDHTATSQVAKVKNHIHKRTIHANKTNYRQDFNLEALGQNTNLKTILWLLSQWLIVHTKVMSFFCMHRMYSNSYCPATSALRRRSQGNVPGSINNTRLLSQCINKTRRLLSQCINKTYRLLSQCFLLNSSTLTGNIKGQLTIGSHSSKSKVT